MKTKPKKAIKKPLKTGRGKGRYNSNGSCRIDDKLYELVMEAMNHARA